MGEVYLAQDTKLRRLVALKLLTSGLTKKTIQLRRFEQEARAASVLNHPNILTIYERRNATYKGGAQQPNRIRSPGGLTTKNG